jgi:pantoate--beta-alanine ligase
MTPEVVTTIEAFRARLGEARRGGAVVGLVPTMGALHDGHSSLIRRAAAENGFVATTVFVNPLQFGAGEDLGAYPRDLERDLKVAEQAGAHLVFAPPETEMYPGPVLTSVTVSPLADRWEGASRPGHFAGVATVVAKLFNITGPCRAYFGEKDFQQLAVIRQMVTDLSAPLLVVGCPTVRDDDGLALSSRNVYLDGDERRAATVLHKALLAARQSIELHGERDPERVGALMAAIVAEERLARLDYAAAVDPTDLTVPSRLAGEVRLIVAAQVGPARLIDNMGATCIDA